VGNRKEAVDIDVRNTSERNEGVRIGQDWDLQQIRMSTVTNFCNAYKTGNVFTD
jgi:hypothetical protein